MTTAATTRTVTDHGPRVRYRLDELPDGIHPVTANAAIEVISLHPSDGYELGACHVDRWLVTIAGKGTFSTVRGEHSLARASLRSSPPSTLLSSRLPDLIPLSRCGWRSSPPAPPSPPLAPIWDRWTTGPATTDRFRSARPNPRRSRNGAGRR